jgi:hypothetical protein
MVPSSPFLSTLGRLTTHRLGYANCLHTKHTDDKEWDDRASS